VTQPDPIAAAAAVKRTTALLRDARSVQRRLDVLLAMAMAAEDASLPRIAEARDAVERLVSELTFREQVERRQARQAVRRLR
jgi:transcription initiation factor TFIIIB Brf1 subunit/transcription initiation factor TFIIB